MVRTKHLVVSIFGIGFFVAGYGLALPGADTFPVHPVEPVTFVLPEDRYGVAGPEGDDRGVRRSAFIASVRSALQAEPVAVREVPEEPEVVEETPVAPEPVPVAIAVPFGAGDYGDAQGTITPQAEPLEEKAGTTTKAATSTQP